MKSEAQPGSQLSRFDLDFPGGSPGQLIKAIENANGKPLNAIIPEDLAGMQLPALKMRAVTVPELFDALHLASSRNVSVPNVNPPGYAMGLPYSQYQVTGTSYGFRTVGTPREDSIWIFYHEAPPINPPASPRPVENICRYYQLAPYLETYKIEDITTAIETGWRMLREQNAQGTAQGGGAGGFGRGPFFGGPGTAANQLPRELSFHKDTKLLIAVGEADKLRLIDAVLEQLKPMIAKPKPAGGTAPAPTRSLEPAHP